MAVHVERGGGRAGFSEELSQRQKAGGGQEKGNDVDPSQDETVGDHNKAAIARVLLRSALAMRGPGPGPAEKEGDFWLLSPSSCHSGLPCRMFSSFSHPRLHSQAVDTTACRPADVGLQPQLVRWSTSDADASAMKCDEQRSIFASSTHTYFLRSCWI